MKTKVARNASICAVHFMDEDGVLVSVGFPADFELVTKNVLSTKGKIAKPAMLVAAKCSDETLTSNAEAYLLGHMVSVTKH